MTYDIIQSETPYLDGSGSYSAGQFTTDASGDGSSSQTSMPVPGDIFEVIPQSGAGFIGGFSVPK